VTEVIEVTIEEEIEVVIEVIEEIEVGTEEIGEIEETEVIEVEEEVEEIEMKNMVTEIKATLMNTKKKKVKKKPIHGLITNLILKILKKELLKKINSDPIKVEEKDNQEMKLAVTNSLKEVIKHQILRRKKKLKHPLKLKRKNNQKTRSSKRLLLNLKEK